MIKLSQDAEWYGLEVGIYYNRKDLFTSGSMLSYYVNALTPCVGPKILFQKGFRLR